MFNALKKFPSTRYVGNKNKLINWIWDSVKSLDFTSVLDGFGGTGCLSYKFKQENKDVTYNDFLLSNCIQAKGLLENQNTYLDKSEALKLFIENPEFLYSSFVYDTFEGIYYTNEENKEIDVIIQNITRIENEYQRCIATYCFYQALITKRPYGGFQRKTLNFRLSKKEERKVFTGNTWERPISEYFFRYLDEVNDSIFESTHPVKILNMDIFSCPNDFDLVYFDPPYIRYQAIAKYIDLYHFLEGLSDYDNWKDKVAYESINRRFKKECTYNIFEDKKKTKQAFYDLFEKFKNSKIVLSYRDDGIPSLEEILEIIKKLNRTPTVHTKEHKYTFSKKESNTEVLIIF